MKKTFNLRTWIVLGLVASQLASSAEAAQGRRRTQSTSEPISNAYGDRPDPLLSYTHRLPSPFTLPAGRLIFGTEVALGLTNFLQVGTNILRDFYKIYNANAKVSLLEFPRFAMGASVGFEYFNLNDIDRTNPDAQVTSWLPGLVFTFIVIPRVSFGLGGNLNYSDIKISSGNTVTSGYQRGAQAEADISWAYNPPSGNRLVSNVLSAGVSYDFTYKIAGYGISHHWPGFQLGIHYYPNATQYRVQPILAGGGVFDF